MRQKCTVTIRPTFNIQLTRPTENIPLTRPTENGRLTRPTEYEILTRPMDSELLTRPTDSELLTRPTDFELLTRPTEFPEKNKKSMNRRWTQTQNLHRQICQRHLHWTQEQRKIKARRRKSVVSIGKMTRQTRLRATTLILPMTVITDASDGKRRNTGKIIRSNNAQL